MTLIQSTGATVGQGGEGIHAYVDNLEKPVTDCGSVKLDGTFDGIDVEPVLPSNNGLRTIEAWVKWTPQTGGEYLYASNCESISYTESSQSLFVQFFQGCNGTGSRHVVPGAIPLSEPIPNGEWAHVAVQTDGTTGVNVFINGKNVGGGVLTLQTGISGNYEGGIGYRTDGGTVEGEAKLSVAEFRISDFVRYTSDFIPTNNWSLDSATTLLFTFDEGAGSPEDVAGGPDAVLVGGATWKDNNGPSCVYQWTSVLTTALADHGFCGNSKSSETFATGYGICGPATAGEQVSIPTGAAPSSQVWIARGYTGPGGGGGFLATLGPNLKHLIWHGGSSCGGDTTVSTPVTQYTCEGP
jgi:hypothetical protein